MNQSILPKLFVLIIGSSLLSSCSSEKANATSLCPSSINSARIVLLDSVTEESITTASVIIAGQTYDKSIKQLSDSELIVSYSNDLEVYYLPYEFNSVEINPENVTIYAIDSGYNSNVSKPKQHDISCSELEYTIYLCPIGSACR